MPRATTAACEVMPPRAVTMALAACMPWMSSGRGFIADQDDRFARRSQTYGVIGGEDDLARGRTRRCRQTLGDDDLLGLGVEHRVQQLIEAARIDAHQRFLPA